jgi:hypothetical protein
MLRKPPAGRTPIDRDRIALKLLERARAGDSGVLAVWYGGGASISIKRNVLDEHPVSISWREAHRLAFPEEYVEPEVPRKRNARFQGAPNRRRIAS